MTSPPWTIKAAQQADDSLIAEFFFKMWQDYDMDNILQDDWLNGTLEFIRDARERYQYAAFIADVEGKAVGSAACQIFHGLYPSIFRPEKRQYGYIWGVYVRPETRGQGIAQALTKACNDYLKGIGCTKVLLHASPMGKPVYEKLGFVTSNEMVLDFSKS